MLVKKNHEKNKKSTNKVHPGLYKMKQKETKQCASFITLERKTHYLSTKQKGTAPTLDVYYYQGKLYYNDN